MSGDANASVANSRGIADIKNERNSAHQALVMAETEASNLFDNAIVKKFTMHELQEQQRQPRAMPVTLTIDGDNHEVHLLRPVRTRDTVWVALCDLSMAPVLHIAASNGFYDASPKKCHDGLKGVHKHARGYLVYYDDETGNKKAKLIKGTMQDVHIFKSDPMAWLQQEREGADGGDDADEDSDAGLDADDSEHNTPNSV